MRKSLFVLGSLALLAVIGAGGWWWYTTGRFTPPPPWADDMQVIADGNNRFAFELYAKLAESEKDNLFFSPYSAHTVLAQGATGARGKTRDEMLAVLHLPAGDAMLASGDLGAFYAHRRKDFELSVANALWGQKKYGWEPDWLSIQKTRFGAGFREADFQSDPDRARQRINRWVEKQTRDRIKEILKPGIITSNTRMVLANAIAFKGEWEKPFEVKDTRDGPFTLADGTTVPVPMMHRKGGFRRFAQYVGDSLFEAEFQVAEVPYRGGELSMVILLPGKPDGLPALEARITPEALAKWLTQAREVEKVSFAMPKFRIETDAMMLEGPLRKLGMVTAFQPDVADFGGMCSRPLAVSSVVQKAFVDVNEEGTEAAAATTMTFQLVGDTISLDFHADHPFLFLIRDVKHGTILFLGRVMNPRG